MDNDGSHRTYAKENKQARVDLAWREDAGGSDEAPDDRSCTML